MNNRASPPANGRSDEGISRPAHILIVEDSELVTSALRLLFEATGRRVSVAASVSEALAVGIADPADLVLVDVTLPDGDGLEVIEPLRVGGSRAFVALTGHDDTDTAARCRAAGCIDVAIKPVAVRELVSNTARWLAAGAAKHEPSGQRGPMPDATSG